MRRLALIILIVLLLAFDNIIGIDKPPILYQSYAGLNVAKVLVLSMFPVLFFLRNKIFTKIDVILALMLLMGIIVGVLSGNSKVVYVSNDLGVVITIWTGYSFYRVLYGYNVFRILFIVGIFFATIALFNYFNGIGELVGTHRRPLMDSGRNIITITFLYSLIMLREKFSVIWIIYAIVSLTSIILIGSRGQLVLTMLPLAVYIFLSGNGLLLLSVSFTFIILWFIVVRTNEGLISFLKWKLTSFSIFDSRGGISSAGARYFEFLNMYADMAEDWTLYFGRGIGGYFTDNHYPFMSVLKGKSAYDIDQIRLREISNPHGFQFWIMLKFGFLTFFFLLIRVVRSFLASPIYKKVIIFLAVFCLYKSFTLKMQLVSGVFLGLAIDE